MSKRKGKGKKGRARRGKGEVEKVAAPPAEPQAVEDQEEAPVPSDGASRAAALAAGGPPITAADLGIEDTVPEPEPAAASRPLAPSWKALGLTVGISALAFFTGLGLFNFVVMPKWVHQGEETLVPDLRSLDTRQAEGVLDQAGLRLSIRGEQYDPGVPKGAVISQSPRPNESVRRGRVVIVLVSLGEEFASVPALYGESMRNTRILLARAGLLVGDIVQTHSEALGPGLVLASEPPAQAVVPHGTPVHLVESLGPVAEAYLMPELRGLDARVMAQNLEALGFRVRLEGPAAGFATVTEQYPPPGSRVESGEEIVLRVAGRMIR